MNPTRLGRFEILRVVGQGAMGQVFLAHDPKIDRKVAIKTITVPPGVSAEEARELSQRFLREAQAAGKLLHPNIVTIFDVAEEDGVSFIAMEYIEGDTLASHTRPAGLLPLARVLDLIAQAASALDYAHKHNVVHRDIKPANLMMLKDGTLKVTDFGLAKNPSNNLTQAGVLLGTPSYMSPEQIQGAELDGRSDLFSLGVVLYELLTGVRPFEADTISTTIYRVLYEDPRPPAAHNPALPPEINLILAKALAKVPERRYASGADMVVDLGKAFGSLPAGVLSRPAAGASSPVPGRNANGTLAPGAPQPTTIRNERGARRPAARTREGRGAPGRGAPAQGVPRNDPTLIAHHPAKIAALLVTVVIGLVLFPRWVNMHEPAPEEAGVAVPGMPDGVTHLNAAGLGGAAPETGGLPGDGAAAAGGNPGAGGQIAIEVSTIPHGATILLDTLPLAVPRVVLARADPRPHDIEARAGCFHAVAEMTAADLASFGGPLVLELHPRREPVPIRSEPPGARILINDRPTGQTTPASVEIDGCQERTITLEHDGFKAWTASYDADADFQAMIETLGQVALERIPGGTVVIKKPRGYDVDIYDGAKRLGKAGTPLDLPEGTHRLTFRNDGVFLRTRARVKVLAGQTVVRTVALPSLGALTVQAQPSNCKVYIDGIYADVTPLFEKPVAAGTHRVKVVFVPNGKTREETAEVKAGQNTRVMVRF